MILNHYSNVPIGAFVNGKRRYAGTSFYGMKPRGLWVSVDDAEQNWVDWCASEKFGLDRFNYRTPVKLAAGHNILILETVEAIKDFHRKYREELYPGGRMEYIHWEDVRKDYDGIIITPYQWSMRLNFAIWYYGWDCASGCIWDAKAVELGESQPFDIAPIVERDEAEFQERLKQISGAKN